jgi:hypothetical protein
VLLNEKAMEALYQTVNDGAKQAIHYSRESGSSYNGPKNYEILKETILSEYYGFGMGVNNFIFKPYTDKLAQLQESGIIERILRIFKPKKPITSDNRVALSLDHLMIWFKLLIALLLITFGVFHFSSSFGLGSSRS